MDDKYKKNLTYHTMFKFLNIIFIIIYTNIFFIISFLYFIRITLLEILHLDG